MIEVGTFTGVVTLCIFVNLENYIYHYLWCERALRTSQNDRKAQNTACFPKLRKPPSREEHITLQLHSFLNHTSPEQKIFTGDSWKVSMEKSIRAFRYRDKPKQTETSSYLWWRIIHLSVCLFGVFFVLYCFSRASVFNGSADKQHSADGGEMTHWRFEPLFSTRSRGHHPEIKWPVSRAPFYTRDWHWKTCLHWNSVPFNKKPSNKNLWVGKAIYDREAFSLIYAACVSIYMKRVI